MVQINDDYIVQIDNLNYTVLRDAHRKTTRKDKDGKKVEVDTYVTVGYYHDLAGSIRGVIKDMNVRALSDGVHDLKEALEIVVNNNDQFTRLLEQALKVKEVQSYEKS